MEAHEKRDYERLRAEGRWLQASEYRESERKRLREAGRSRRQAREESWIAMLTKFPPLGQIEPQPPDVDSEQDKEGVFIDLREDEWMELDELVQDPAAWEGCWSEALSWANSYRKIEVTPSRAPTVLAWILWKLCRADAYRFTAMLFTDFCLRHGYRMSLSRTNDEHEAWMREEMSSELASEELLVELDEEDRRVGRSPTLIEAIEIAETEDEVDRLMDRALEEHAAREGWVYTSPASSSSKS